MRLTRSDHSDEKTALSVVSAPVQSPVESTVHTAGPVLARDAAMPAAAGLESQFRAFYERNYGIARDFAERFANRVEAEDAVQEAMTEVWLKWQRRGPDEKADRYFLAIVRHKVIDQQRHNRRAVALEDAEEQLESISWQAHPKATRATLPADVLDVAMNALPPKRREVFLLAHEHEYTYKEVATLLHVSEGTVKTHLRLATANLRSAFAAAGYLGGILRTARLATPSSTDTISTDVPTDDSTDHGSTHHDR